MTVLLKQVVYLMRYPSYFSFQINIFPKSFSVTCVHSALKTYKHFNNHFVFFYFFSGLSWSSIFDSHKCWPNTSSYSQFYVVCIQNPVPIQFYVDYSSSESAKAAILFTPAALFIPAALFTPATLGIWHRWPSWGGSEPWPPLSSCCSESSGSHWQPLLVWCP